MKGRGHSEDIDVDGDTIRMDLKETVERVWTGFVWHRIGPCNGIFYLAQNLAL
jgi:hypothetical protein